MFVNKEVNNIRDNQKLSTTALIFHWPKKFLSKLRFKKTNLRNKLIGLPLVFSLPLLENVTCVYPARARSKAWYLAKDQINFTVMR